MKKIAFPATVIILPLVAGLVVYVVLRPGAIVSAFVYRFFGLSPLNLKTPDNPFWNFINFYLCDFLWAFSLGAAVLLILGRGRFRALIAFAVCVAVSALTEICQMRGIIPGTPDVLDVVTESAGSFLSIIITYVFLRRK